MAEPHRPWQHHIHTLVATLPQFTTCHSGGSYALGTAAVQFSGQSTPVQPIEYLTNIVDSFLRYVVG
jgi:hypothetical protein